ncbi:MAG: DUF924 domain-containing protein [Gammaproteobacteria bacterium]|nr:DUF924 domain-containing protein [Gammaproteobacteria bacterium]NNF62135.1 DUF924 domain-containing protein [Gammaproteobacteria bacterium]
MSTAEDVLEFWLGDTRRDIDSIPQRMEFWFASGAQQDQPIRDQFGDDVVAARDGRLDDWAEAPEGCLGLIILLDQFTRNIYRGAAEAFASDNRSLSLSQAGIVAGHDGRLGPVEKVFFYMPMQHAESLAVQMQSVSLYEALADSVPESSREFFDGGFAHHARLHRDIIARFGRFPHRNAILGRESTAEEAEYLAGDAPTFGQKQT